MLLILFSTVLDYTISILIDKSDNNNSRRKIYLLVSIITNLSLLAYFKYLYFIVDNINFIFYSKISLYQIILPFGISFYTFETISYTTDVYRRLIKPESNFLRYALFVTFFPKLVAGPIQRTKEFLDQVINPNKFSLDNLFKGFRRIIEGLFLKVVLADNLSTIVDDGFNIDPVVLSGVDVMTHMLYLDFKFILILQVTRDNWMCFIAMDLKFLKTLIIHIYHNHLKNFGKDGIYHYHHG